MAAVTRSRGSKWPQKAHRKRLHAAQAALNAAKVAYESIKRQSVVITDFIQRIKGYYNAQKDAGRHNFLLRWIHQQIPVIDLESKTSASDSTGTGCVANGERRNVTEAEDVDERQHFEGQRHDTSGRKAVPIETAPVGSALKERGKRERGSHEPVDEYRLSKRSKKTSQARSNESSPSVFSDATGAAIPLRRGVRIAQQRKSATISTQMPTPLPSITSKIVMTTALIKAKKRSCPGSERQ
ncbi:hypothetical protein LTR28_003640 [Elasticomyces elasticus]|nr:hypothetical protein LTR28_003640 [Elasticomyces elasticus]